MNYRALLSLIPNLPADHTVLLTGVQGIGKSSFIRQIGKMLSLPVYDRRVAQLVESDIVGIPDRSPEDKKGKEAVMRMLPPDYILSLCQNPGILFLDEINRGSRQVQAACFELALDRSVYGRKLHPETRVYSAINLGSQFQVNAMDPAFLDRFTVFKFEPTVEEWLLLMEGEGLMSREMVKFLREHTTLADPLDNADINLKNTSRRSWTRLSQTFDKIGLWNPAPGKKRMHHTDINPCSGESVLQTVQNLADAYVGYKAAASLVTYVEMMYSASVDVGDEEIVVPVMMNLEDFIKGGYKKMGPVFSKLTVEQQIAFMSQFTEYFRTHDISNFEAQSIGWLFWNAPLESSEEFLKMIAESCNLDNSSKTDEEKGEIQQTAMCNLAVLRRYIVGPLLVLHKTLDEMPDPLSWHGLILSDEDDALKALEYQRDLGGVPSILAEDGGKPIPLSKGALASCLRTLGGYIPCHWKSDPMPGISAPNKDDDGPVRGAPWCDEDGEPLPKELQVYPDGSKRGKHADRLSEFLPLFDKA